MVHDVLQGASINGTFTATRLEEDPPPPPSALATGSPTWTHATRHESSDAVHTRCDPMLPSSPPPRARPDPAS
jgi:hypothetical protein